VACHKFKAETKATIPDHCYTNKLWKQAVVTAQ